jgi:hypothetical protein
MRYLTFLLAVLLTACGPSPNPIADAQEKSVAMPDRDGCIVDSSSKLVNQHTVGPIRNLVKDKDENGSCTVRFDITVDGKEYHLEETEDGLEQIESLCYYARERARKELLLDLGGTFKTESTVACKQRD